MPGDEEIKEESKEGRLSLEQLKQHAFWQFLTPKQARFLEHYIENRGNYVLAAEQAGFKSNTAAYRLLRSTYIRKLLALYQGIDDDFMVMGKAELVGIIAARLRRGDLSDLTMLRLMEMLTTLRGWRIKSTKGAALNAAKGVDLNATKEKLQDPSIGEDEIDVLVRQLEEERKNGTRYGNSQGVKETDGEAQASNDPGK